jgi:hypothetical protein
MIDLRIDAGIAELAGAIRRSLASRRRTPDAVIAATALIHEIALMTRNGRHFDRVRGLRVITPESG